MKNLTIFTILTFVLYTSSSYAAEPSFANQNEACKFVLSNQKFFTKSEIKECEDWEMNLLKKTNDDNVKWATEILKEMK